MEGIKNYLHDQQTHPEVQRAIMYSLRQWRKGRNIDFLQFSTPVRRAVVEQSHIGWLEMMEGTPSKQWRRVQAAHYQELGVRKSSLKWMRGLLTRLQKLAWKQWDHRNRIKHEALRPQDVHAIGRLNNEVIRILQEIPSLPAADRSHLQRNVTTLIRSTNKQKLSWLHRANVALQNAARVREHNLELVAISKESSKLFQWSRTCPLRE